MTDHNDVEDAGSSHERVGQSDPKSHITVQSSLDDSLHLLVNRAKLENGSAVLRTMLANKERGQVLKLPEPGSNLFLLLRILETPPSPPRMTPDIEKLTIRLTARYDATTIIPFTVLNLLIPLAVEYALDARIMRALEMHLIANAPEHALEVYALASRFEMARAAAESSQHVLPLASYTAKELESIPTAVAYHRLHQLQVHRETAFRSILLRKELFPHRYGACSTHTNAATVWRHAALLLVSKLECNTDIGAEMESLIQGFGDCETCFKAASIATEMISGRSAEPTKPDPLPVDDRTQDGRDDYPRGSSVGPASAKGDGYREKQIKPNKVYIGGLPEHTRMEDLQNCFGQLGHIVNIELKVGYGFVEFETRLSAEESVAKYHEGHFMGNKIRVELSHGGGRTAKYAGEPGACFKCGNQGHWARECGNTGPPRRDDRRDARDMPPRDSKYDYSSRDYRRAPSPPPRDYRDYPPPPRGRDFDDYRRGPPPSDRDRYGGPPPPPDYRGGRYGPPDLRGYGAPPPPPVGPPYDRYGGGGRYGRDDFDRGPPPPRSGYDGDYRGRPLSPPSRYDYARGPPPPDSGRYRRRSESPQNRSSGPYDPSYSGGGYSNGGYSNGPPPRSREYTTPGRSGSDRRP
ncbi:RNA-binding protein lark [Mycena kentingensis (nom. inval.)]|nr:RNA-binding protein lark [Mycena kentingensis (nom. inval.)]